MQFKTHKRQISTLLLDTKFTITKSKISIIAAYSFMAVYEVWCHSAIRIFHKITELNYSYHRIFQTDDNLFFIIIRIFYMSQVVFPSYFQENITSQYHIFINNSHYHINIHVIWCPSGRNRVSFGVIITCVFHLI